MISGLITGGMNLLGGELQQSNSAQQVQQQEQFQQNMADTTFTRAVSNMEQAGLNPMLAAGAQAPSPGGASFQPQNVVGQAVSSGFQNAQIQKQIDVAGSQNENIKTDTDNKLFTGQILSHNIDAAESNAKTAANNADITGSRAIMESAQANFIKKNPWYVPTSKALGMAGSLVGTANQVSNLGNPLGEVGLPGEFP